MQQEQMGGGSGKGGGWTCLNEVLVAVVVAVQLLQAGAHLGPALLEALLGTALHTRHLALHSQQPLCPPLHHALHPPCCRSFKQQSML